MKRIRLNVTTDTAGAGTSDLVGVPGGGTLYALQLIDGDLADNVDITVTAEVDGLSIPLFVKANFNTDQIAYPRVLQHLATDGSDLTTHCEPVVFGSLKAVIAQGGSIKTGAVVAYIREL